MTPKPQPQTGTTKAQPKDNHHDDDVIAATLDDVCENRACGWSAGVWNEDTACPRCGSEVQWHDDLALLTEVVTGGQNILQTSEDAMDRMQALGVLKRDDEGQVFIGFQKAHLFAFSALSQAHRRIEALETALAEHGIEVPGRVAS